MRLPQTARSLKFGRWSVSYWPAAPRFDAEIDFSISRGARRDFPIVIRFGRYGWRVLSERYQGEHGFPKRFYYFLGKRITIIRPRKRTHA